MPVRVAGEREARQRVVPAGGEQDERVPAIAPRRADGVRRFEDHEAPLLLGERMADRKPRLPGADDGDVVPHVAHDNPFSSSSRRLAIGGPHTREGVDASWDWTSIS